MRTHYRVSSAIPRNGNIEARLLTTERPHPQATPAGPTLEEAYLLLQ